MLTVDLYSGVMQVVTIGLTTHHRLPGRIRCSGGQQSYKEWARPVPLSWGWPRGCRCLPALKSSGQQLLSSLQPAGTALPPLGQSASCTMALGQGHGAVPMSYSSYEKPSGNLLLKQITEPRCGLASPLLSPRVAIFWCQCCPHWILSGAGRDRPSVISEYQTFPSGWQIKCVLSLIQWKPTNQTKQTQNKKSTPAALTLGINLVLRANLRPWALLTTDSCLSRDYSRYNRTARVIYVVPPN